MYCILMSSTSYRNITDSQSKIHVIKASEKVERRCGAGERSLPWTTYFDAESGSYDRDVQLLLVSLLHRCRRLREEFLLDWLKEVADHRD